MNKNIPNCLTMLRVLMIPAFVVVLMRGHAFAAAILFALASATDALDGHLARKYDLISNFGKLMDPLADKLLVVSAFACFVELGVVPAWVLIVILAREFTITGLRAVAASEGVVIAAGASGKLKTVFQMLAVLALLLRDIPGIVLGAAFVPWGARVAVGLLAVAVLLTIYSGAEYVVKSRQLFR
ncbi:MAG: CDP-diacylglycerol--glycerol-3-phosphate 3-phosphatidyltransferase [Clostridiales Family XIII bacterium]|jgi:CDP-diacylglycerol--glycerol-3-phosphate 3-phosphatidyltransferase/cardiolipin synthase|nr:CDP-diacylglycerol--glycerol-3-phosphate 3-phosphatidyltransferase [Clostridiales Family XIII bacterium]